MIACVLSGKSLLSVLMVRFGGRNETDLNERNPFRWLCDKFPEKLVIGITQTVQKGNQNNKNEFETITQSKTFENLCPVVTWALIVQRIWSYPNTRNGSNYSKHRFYFIPSTGVYTAVSNKNVIKLLRDAVTACGPVPTDNMENLHLSSPFHNHIKYFL